MRYARIPIVLVLALCLCSCSIQPLFDWDVLLDLPLDGGQDEIKRENPMLDELHFSLPDSDIEEFYAGLSQCKAIYEKCHKSYADELEDALYELE